MTTTLCILFKKMFLTLKSWRYFSVLSSEHFLVSHLGHNSFGINFFFLLIVKVHVFLIRISCTRYFFKNQQLSFLLICRAFFVKIAIPAYGELVSELPVRLCWPICLFFVTSHYLNDSSFLSGYLAIEVYLSHFPFLRSNCEPNINHPLQGS